MRPLACPRAYVHMIVICHGVPLQGQICAEEFLEILQRDGSVWDLATAKMMLNSIMKAGHDTDGDGHISIEELASALADEEDHEEEKTERV